MDGNNIGSILSSCREIASENETIAQEINNLEHFPNDYENWLRLGDRLFEFHSYNLVIKSYDIVLQASPYNTADLYGTGLT